MKSNILLHAKSRPHKWFINWKGISSTHMSGDRHNHSISVMIWASSLLYTGLISHFGLFYITLAAQRARSCAWATTIQCDTIGLGKSAWKAAWWESWRKLLDFHYKFHCCSSVKTKLERERNIGHLTTKDGGNNGFIDPKQQLIDVFNCSHAERSCPYRKKYLCISKAYCQLLKSWCLSNFPLGSLVMRHSTTLLIFGGISSHIHLAAETIEKTQLRYSQISLIFGLRRGPHFVTFPWHHKMHMVGRSYSRP